MSTVVVTRPRHPLEGSSLPVLGRMRRHGAVELLVVLPDGSKTLLPAAWTDLDPAAGDRGGPGTLGSLADLLDACALASALAARAADEPEQAARQSPSKEDNRAARAAQSEPDQIPAPPAALVEQLPAAQIAAAVGQLAGLIAKAADPSAARNGQQAGGDE